MNIVLKRELNGNKFLNYIDNAAFLAMQKRDENLAISILMDKEFDICELIDFNGEKVNFLFIAVYYGLDKVVDYLLNNKRFKKVINDGKNPFYSILIDKDLIETIEINLEKRMLILDKLLSCKEIEIPEEYPILLQLHSKFDNLYGIKQKYNNEKVENIFNEKDYKLFLDNCIKKVLVNEKINKHINKVFNPENTYLIFFIKNKNYDAANLVLNNKRFNQLNYDYVHNLLFHHINAATSCFDGTGDVGFIGKNTIVEEEYLYKILLDQRFDIDLVLNVLITLLIYYGKHQKKGYNNSLQIQRIILKVIKEKQFPNKEANYYDELVFTSALYGNIDVFKLLMQKQNIILSSYTQSLVNDYATELYNNQYKEEIKFMLENSADEINLEEVLARHILVYGTCIYGDQYNTKLSNLESIALNNIIKYFNDEEKIREILLNMKLKIPYISVYNKAISHKKECFMDCNEYELYRCYYPDEETFIEQLEKSKLVAKLLISMCELKFKNKVKSKK